MKNKIMSLILIVLFHASCDYIKKGDSDNDLNKIVDSIPSSYFLIDTIFEENEISYTLKDKNNSATIQHIPYYINISYKEDPSNKKEAESLEDIQIIENSKLWDKSLSEKWKIRFFIELKKEDLAFYPTKGILKIDTLSLEASIRERKIWEFETYALSVNTESFELDYGNTRDNSYFNSSSDLSYKLLEKISNAKTVKLILWNLGNKSEIVLSPNIIKDAKASTILFDELKNTNPMPSWQ